MFQPLVFNIRDIDKYCRHILYSAERGVYQGLQYLHKIQNCLQNMMILKTNQIPLI